MAGPKGDRGGGKEMKMQRWRMGVVIIVLEERWYAAGRFEARRWRRRRKVKKVETRKGTGIKIYQIE